jgi:hypothetical protein
MSRFAKAPLPMGPIKGKDPNIQKYNFYLTCPVWLKIEIVKTLYGLS